MHLDPHHLAALVAILRHGSFELAASELAVTPSAVSQRIKALEDRVGASLIHRGTPCTGTPTGLRLAQHAEDIGVLETQLARELSLNMPETPARVRIALPADNLATWFIEAMARTDGYLFDLVIDDQDHSAEWLRRGEVSAAITVGGHTVPGCDSITLGTLRYLPTASPGYMEKWFGDGVSAETIARAPCLTFNRKDKLQKVWLSRQFNGRITPPLHFLPSTQAFVDASIAGIGWGMNPEILVQPALKAGQLQEVIPDTPLDVSLTWQVGRILSSALEPLTKAVRQAASKGLTPK